MIVTAVVGIVAVYAAAPAVPPRVVATSPAQGATVAPGALALRVTFDRPMGAGYSFVHVDAETFPDCAPAPEPSRDRRSFTLRCRVEAGRNYELWFNRAPYMNFRGADGTRAAPYRLRFSAAR